MSLYAIKDEYGGIGTVADEAADNTADEQFTAEEIDKYHLGGFEKVEVEDNAEANS